MTDSIDIKTCLPTRVGLSSHAIFLLWKTALKDDETLLDEAIVSVHEQMTSLDQARAEQVMSLIIRRHRDAKEAFKAMLMAIRTQSRLRQRRFQRRLHASNVRSRSDLFLAETGQRYQPAIAVDTSHIVHAPSCGRDCVRSPTREARSRGSCPAPIKSAAPVA